ncbi:hypothetical protein Q4575_05405 [Psychrosphaera sp. 1_MG-2023]|uniref:hypothetical protein n=1 Tax=Psychrosphaera sp. 1_MG-2023 TaxID=3062643 RepID=UPI0026E48D77|nr:hypothetical protein [Psychrosphaera sp. 1_MG-2023]MDO6718827.1 hypothetical protein [Psychrosphaera sp. 1_MG-2023]
MDFEFLKTLFSFVSVVLLPLIYFLFQRSEKAFNKSLAVEQELNAHQFMVAREYVTKEDLKDHLIRIEKTLDELKVMLTNQR